MDNSQDNIDVFANILQNLQQNKASNTTSLYRDVNLKKTGPQNVHTDSVNMNKTLSAADVISNVARQIKALQGSEKVKPNKTSRLIMNKNQPKSTFVSVNMLSEQSLQPPNLNVCNKQKLEEIADLPTCVGVTQEFEMSFQQEDIADICQSSQNKEFESLNIIDISLKEPDVSKIINSPNIRESNLPQSIHNTTWPKQEQTSVENCTQILNEYIEIEKDDQIDIFIDEAEEFNSQKSIKKPLSPVFNVRSKINKTNDNSLVVSLDSFEKFEKIAQPIIEMTTDTHRAKILMNSQIVGTDLCVKTEQEQIFEDHDQTSPVLELLNQDFRIDSPLQHQIDSDDKMKPDTKPKEKIKSVRSKNNVLEEDEILFSSDEENDSLFDSFKDLPFTCALETSFYDEDDVLDKTMYVGFHTASNKSILVKTDSFSKAKSIFDDVDGSTNKKSLITEQIEKPDEDDAEIDPENLCKAKGTETKCENQSDSQELDALNCIKKEQNPEFESESFAINTETYENLVRQASFNKDFGDLFVETKEIPTDNNSATLNTVIQVKDHNPVALSEEKSTVKAVINQGIARNRFDNTENTDHVNIISTPKLEENVKESSENYNPRVDVDDDILQEFLEEIDLDISFPNNNTKNIKDEPSVVTFKTANNNPILISETALVKSKDIFKDIDLTAIDEENSEMGVIYSKGKLKQSKGIEDVNDSSNYVVEKENLNKQPSISKDLPGFKTAANKEISISSKALDKAKNIFKDLNEVCPKDLKGDIQIDVDKENKGMVSNILIDSDENSKDSDKEPPLYGFEQSEEDNSLVRDFFEKTQKVFENIGDCEGEIKHIESKSHHQGGINSKETKNFASFCVTNLILDNTFKSFEGFKTASNKEINISANSFEKGRKVFQEVNGYDNYIMMKKPLNTGKNVHNMQPTNKTPIKISGITLARTRKIFENLNNDSITGDKHKDNVSKFCDFQAASDKKVSVSTDALRKTKNDFQGITNNDNFKTNSSVTMSTDKRIEGFRTASNKHIKISERALQTSRNLFQDIHKDSETIYPAEGSNSIESRSARTKQVKVSENAIEVSRKLFQDEIEEQNWETVQEDGSSKITFKGFQTASNKKVEISKQALEKSRKIFQDMQNEEYVYGGTKNIEDTPTNKFQGFQTASKKAVKISEKALQRSRKLFQDIDENLIIPKSSKHAKLVLNFGGFHTASNKNIEISEDSLKKSRILFQDLQGNNNDNKTNTECQTATSNIVDISNASLTGRRISEDIQETTEIQIIRNEKPASNVMGFQTASNKAVKVSDETLRKSRELFQDIHDANAEESSRGREKIGSFAGFQTANNKEIPISETALQASRKLLKDLVNEPEPVNNKCFVGFQTASNKEVNVSDEALKNSKKIFENIIDLDTEKSPHVKHMEGFIGFQTASKKDVKISKEALEKSKKLFQDLNDLGANVPVKNEDSETKPETSHLVSPRSRILFQNIDKSPIRSIDKCQFKTKDKDMISISKKTILKPKATMTHLEQREKKHNLIKTPDNQTDFEINTEVMNDFERTFKEDTPMKSKRSGSPILSCPKAKKRKVFKIPYSQKVRTNKDTNEEINHTEQSTEIPKIKPVNFTANYKVLKPYNLKDLLKLEAESNSDAHIEPYVLHFDFETLQNFEFSDNRNDVTESKLNVTELQNIFTNSVNKKLIPNGWLDIQTKLILWKLISYEIAFPKTMQLTCTARNVLDQLKFRYDKELYNAERPILRKIMERDDVSTRSLVLCVVSFCGNEDQSAPQEMVLTDGWYTIRAVTDRMLSEQIKSGKIKVGTKLFTHGAELVGSEQAVSSWEDTSSLRLKLHGNSTRRARWHARLGCHRAAAILSRLSDVTVGGGRVAQLRVFVARVYPALYVDKFEDGSTVTRSERLEHIYQMKYEAERQAILDKIYEEAEREIDQDSEDSEEPVLPGNKRKRQDSGSQATKVMKRDGDIQYQSQLTSSQREKIQEYNFKKRDKIIAKLQERVESKMAARGLHLNRNVVTVLKVRVVGIEDKNGDCKVTKAMLSIWRPNEAVSEIVKENTWVEILNVMPTAFRYSELQLSAGRQSVFSQSKHKINDKLKPYIESLKRKTCTIKDLVKNPTKTTDYNEIDVVGIVIQTEPPMKDFDEKTNAFQNVYLSDLDKNIISVNFWGGLRKFGFENCLGNGEIVAGINLQKRAGNTRKSVPHFRVTEFSYFTKTPKSDTARELIEDFREKFTKIDKTDFLQQCLKAKDLSSCQSNENMSPYRFPNIDMNSSKHKAFLKTPVVQNTKQKDDNLNLSGLDFESTFKQQETQLSPKTMLRKQQVKQKIAKLKMYGEPPALSPIQIINKTKNAGNAYKSPLMSKSDVSNVASDEKSLPNEEKNLPNQSKSPVVCLNRTYVKREVKPVKLNFSKNDISDQFAEEFDCSPPLSLD